MSARIRTADPYDVFRGTDGFDSVVGGRVRSLVAEHAARDGTVLPPRRGERSRVLVLLDGDAAPMAIEPHLVRALHPPHLARLEALGLVIIAFRAVSVPIEGGDGRFEALPEDMIALDGGGLILWREPDRRYASAGWSPWRRLCGGTFGGRCASIHAALGWYARALDIEAGRADNFGGA